MFRCCYCQDLLRLSSHGKGVLALGDGLLMMNNSSIDGIKGVVTMSARGYDSETFVRCRLKDLTRRGRAEPSSDFSTKLC